MNDCQRLNNLKSTLNYVYLERITTLKRFKFIYKAHLKSFATKFCTIYKHNKKISKINKKMI